MELIPVAKENVMCCPSNLSRDKRQVAGEARRRALDILTDTLKKKDRLLLNKPGDYVELPCFEECPLVSIQQVQDLITQLQRVTFRKEDSPEDETIASYVMRGRLESIIVLCPLFWEQEEYLGKNSRPGTLINEASRCQIYLNSSSDWFVHVTEKVDEEDQDKRPITADYFRNVFESWMNHTESYTDSYFSCCGETSRDTVCENSKMGTWLRSRPSLMGRPSHFSLSEDEHTIAEEARQRALDILTDALEKKDSLLVEKPEDYINLPRSKNCPLISPQLVQDLINVLQRVKFKKDNNPYHKTTHAYVCTSPREIVMYLCPPFWNQNEYLSRGSRPGTLILEASQKLGYQHFADGSKGNSRESDYKICPLTAYKICSSFEIWMKHKGLYINGFYSCCGERSRDSVCEVSDMGLCLNEIYVL